MDVFHHLKNWPCIFYCQDSFHSAVSLLKGSGETIKSKWGNLTSITITTCKIALLLKTTTTTTKTCTFLVELINRIISPVTKLVWYTMVEDKLKRHWPVKVLLSWPFSLFKMAKSNRNKCWCTLKLSMLVQGEKKLINVGVIFP